MAGIQTAVIQRDSLGRPIATTHMEGTVHESITKFLQHHQGQADRDMRKQLGLGPGDPIPGVGGDYPKMLYSPSYLDAKTEDEREKSIVVVTNPDEEAELASQGFASLAEHKKARESNKTEKKK